jgi:hypothetical protein
MSFGNYITEVRKSEIEMSNILYLIRKNCGPYLKQLRNSPDFLWRGRYNAPTEVMTEIVPIKNREPKDTPVDVHNMLDDIFMDKWKWRARSDSVVFCYGSKSQVKSYGSPNLVFPIGNFSFLWHPTIDDLYMYLKEHTNLIDGYSGDPYDYDYNYGPDSGNGHWEWNGYIVDTTRDCEEAAEDTFNNSYYQHRCDDEARKSCIQLDIFQSEDECYEDAFEKCKGYSINDILRDIELEREWAPDVPIEDFNVDKDKETLEDIISGYRNKNLSAAIKSEHEIMVRCKSYYLINPFLLNIFSTKMEFEFRKMFLKGKMDIYPPMYGDVGTIMWKPKVRKE